MDGYNIRAYDRRLTNHLWLHVRNDCTKGWTWSLAFEVPGNAFGNAVLAARMEKWFPTPEEAAAEALRQWEQALAPIPETEPPAEPQEKPCPRCLGAGVDIADYMSRA